MDRPRRAVAEASATGKRKAALVASKTLTKRTKEDDNEADETQLMPPGDRKAPPIKSSARKKKTNKKQGKPKRTGEDDNADFAPLLSGDSLSHIMEMLLPQEMLNFCSTSKEISSILTHEHVLRAAVVAEKLGVARKNKVTKTRGEASRLNCILDVIKQQTVFIPSPLRFLRLLCGKRCERPGCASAFSMIQGLCVSLCGNCREGFLRATSTRRKYHVHYNWPNVFNYNWTDDKRVAKEHAAYCTFIQSQPYCTPNGERAGALVSSVDIENMLWQGKELEDHLSTIKDVPGFPSDQTCKDLLEINDRALKKYAVLDKEQELKALVRKSQRDEMLKKREHNREIKKNKILKIVRDVSDLLDDPWKEYALSYSWNSSWKGPPNFDCLFVKELMSACMSAPSKATDAKKQELAAAINEGFRDVTESGFHDFSFLSSNEKNEPVEAFMREHLLEKFPTPRLWLRNLHSQRLQYIRTGKLYEALLDMSPSVGVPQYIVKHGGKGIASRLYGESKSLFAEGLWKHVREGSGPSSRDDFLECVQKEALDLYVELCPSVQEALNDNYFFGWYGRDRVQKLLQTVDGIMIAFLRNRDVTGLVAYCRRQFQEN